MGRHYSIKSFFREMPPALLARYFHRQGVLQDFDFTVLKGKKRDELLAAWLGLDDEQRSRMEGDFQEIFDLSHDGAMPAIIAEAAWQMRHDPGAHDAFVEMFSLLPDHLGRSMLTFLDYRECWRGANLFYRADNLPHWRKRVGFPRKPAAVDDESVRTLEGLICGFFHRTEGRGKNCHIDCLRRGDLDYFFAFPADYARQENEWIKGQLAARPHTPAFEIVYIYSEKEGSLDLNFRGDSRRAEVVQAMFAKAILGLAILPPVQKSQAVYKLADFGKPFPFQFDPAGGIQRVVVRMLRLSSKLVDGDRITVEADADANPNAVYELLAKVGRSIDLNHYNITRVELMASMIPKAGAKARTIPFALTHPCYCSLKYDPLGLRLRAMLSASGIEPKEPWGGEPM